MHSSFIHTRKWHTRAFIKPTEEQFSKWWILAIHSYYKA